MAPSQKIINLIAQICWTFECRFAWYSLAWILNPKWVQFWLGKNVKGVVLLPSLQQEMLEQFHVCHQWCPLDVLLNTLRTSLLNSCIVGYLILWSHLKPIPVKWELCLNPIKLEPKPSPWSGENSPIRVLNSILLVNNSPEPRTQKNYPSKSARVRARIQVQIYVVDIIRRASQVSSFMIPKSIMHPLSIDKIVIQSAWQGRRTFHVICEFKSVEEGLSKVKSSKVSSCSVAPGVQPSSMVIHDLDDTPSQCSLWPHSLVVFQPQNSSAIMVLLSACISCRTNMNMWSFGSSWSRPKVPPPLQPL
jgi:hypothetical protein